MFNMLGRGGRDGQLPARPVRVAGAPHYNINRSPSSSVIVIKKTYISILKKNTYSCFEPEDDINRSPSSSIVVIMSITCFYITD